MLIILLQQKNLNLHFNLSNQYSTSFNENSWASKLNPSHLASHIAGGFVEKTSKVTIKDFQDCLLYTSPSPRDATLSRMPSSA